MALAEIIKKILAEAEEKAGSILTQGREASQRIRKEAEIRVQEIAEKTIQVSQDLSDQEARRIISLARLDSKKAVLAARQKILDQVFSDPKIRVKDAIEKTVISFEGESRETLEPEVYLKIWRPGYEARVAEVLFEGITAPETDEK